MNERYTSDRFFLVATCNAVFPNLSGSITMAASAWRSNFTTSQLIPLTAICKAVCPFLSVLLANCGSLSSNVFTISTCPCLAAKCNAFFPLDLDISSKLESFDSSSLTTFICPLEAADTRGVAFDCATVLLRSGSWSNSIWTMAAKKEKSHQTLQADNLLTEKRID